MLHSQNAIEYIELIGTPVEDLDKARFLGDDIDSFKSKTQKLTSKAKGVSIHSLVYDWKHKEMEGKITKCEFNFRGYKETMFSGVLPFELKQTDSWKKCHIRLKNNPEIMNLVVREFSGGKYIVFGSSINGIPIVFKASYPGGSNHKPSKTMFSLTAQWKME